MTTTDTAPAKSAWDQRHEYARHTMGAVVSWFTIFCGLNFATMGWLASSKTSPNVMLVIATAILFISQNMLAILTCLEIRNFVGGLPRAPDGCAEDATQRGVIPIRLYRKSTYQMMAALALIAVSWVAFALIVAHTRATAQP
jgi:hypothetical protein